MKEMRSVESVTFREFLHTIIYNS